MSFVTRGHANSWCTVGAYPINRKYLDFEMPPKGQNAKATAAKGKKAEHADKQSRAQQEQKDQKEAEDWQVGSKNTSKQAAEAAKKEAALKKKQELVALLAAEEKQLPATVRVAPKARGSAKAAEKKEAKADKFAQETRQPEVHMAASNIDDALDLMTAATSTSSTGNTSNVAADGTKILDRHPERRAKAAFAAYEEIQLPILKKENPGLRLSQLKEILYKLWQKAPENPFNQAHIAHNATADQRRDRVEELRQQTEDRLKL